MASKYVWDEKTRRYVERVDSTNTKSTANDISDDDWNAFLAEKRASAAKIDIGSSNRNLPSYTSPVQSNKYALGGSTAIKNSGVTPKLGKIANQSPVFQQNLAAGKSALGLTDEEYERLISLSGDDEAYAREMANIARARVGGLSYIDTSGMKKAEVNALGRMDKLSWRDDIYAALQQDSGVTQKPNIAGTFESSEAYSQYIASGEDPVLNELLKERRTYDDYRNMYANYPEEAMRKDIQNVWSYNTERNVNGTTQEEYEAARRRVYAATGKDYGAIAEQSGSDIAWTREAMDIYKNGQQNVIENIFGGMSETEYNASFEAAMNELNRAGQKGKKLDDWEEQADRATNKQLNAFGSDIDYYRPQPMYLNIDPTYLEGHREYQYEDGTYMPADEFRKNAINEWMMAYVNAGGDEAKIAELDKIRGEYLPEVDGYNLDRLKYLTDDQKRALFIAYNNDDQETVDSLLETYRFGLDFQRASDMEKEWAAKYAGADAGEKVGMNVQSIGQNVGTALEGVKQAVWSIAAPEELKKISEYDPVYDKTRKANITRQMTGEEIALKTEGTNIPWTDRNLWAAIYQGVMSGADSVAISTSLAPLGPVGQAAAMAGITYANERMNKLEAGYSNADANMDAWINAAIEGISEYIPFDIMGKNSPSMLRKGLAGAVAEGLGESASEIGSGLYEEIKYGTGRDELLTQGYDNNNLWFEWLKTQLPDVAEAFVGGVAGGAGSTTVSSIRDSVQNRRVGKTITANEGTEALASLADTLPVSKQAKAIVERMKADRTREGGEDTDKVKSKKYKPVSHAEVGYVFRQTMQNVDKQAQMVVEQTFSRDVVEQALKDAGYKGNVKQAARTATAFIGGKYTRDIISKLEQDSVLRDITLGFTEAAEDMRAYARSEAANVANYARKDFVKPETTKAEKGAEEATKGIEDRAVITAADVEIADTPESTVDGQAVTIEGVANVSDIGTVTYTVKDSEGNTREVSEDDVSIGQNDAVTAVLVENARELGRNADAMIRNYVQGQDVQAYAEAFKQALQYGEDGRNLDVVKGYSDMKALNEGQIATAYEIGRDRRTFRNTRMVRKNTAGIKVGNVDTSQINMHDLNTQQMESVRGMSSLAKAVGFNLKFVESKADAEGRYTTENGSWDPETLTLTLDVHAGSNKANDKNYAMMHTAGHELTHYIKQFADGEMWNAYQEFVIGHLSTKDGKGFDLENAITAHIKTAREQGRYLDRDAAIEEVIANASGDALNKITEADLSALAQDNPGLFNKIKAFFDKWIRRLRERITEAYKGAEARTEEAQQMMDAVDEMGRRWNELLLNATKNRRESAKGENVASEATTTAEAEAPRSIGYRHIDQRTFDSVKEEDTELFASEVDEAQVGMAAAAKILLADLENSIPGQKVWLSDNEVTGQKRQTSALLGRMKDELGLTWDKLRQNLMQFSNMDELVDGEVKLPRNSATNRRIELYLNEMLTEGYTALDGTRINPWDEYFNAISGIEGADSQKKYSTTRGAVDFVDYAWPGEVKYSPRYVGDKPVVWVEDNILSNKPADVKMTDYIVEYLTNHVGEMYTIIESGQHVFIGEEMPEEYVWSEYSKAIRKYNQKLFKAKGRAASGIGEAINIASNRRWEKTKHPKSKDAKYGMYRYDSRIAFPMRDSSGKLTAVKAYNVQLLIRNASDGNKYLYDVVKIKEDTITANNLYEREVMKAEKTAQQKGALNKDIIRDSKQDVKKNQSRDLSNLSDRELLVRALDTELTPDERDHLERYKGKMDKLSEDQRKLEALNSEIVQLRQAGKTQKNSEELRKAMTNATTLRGRIDRTDAELNKIESAAMIKEIVRRNRAEASRSKATSLREWQEKEKYRKMLVTDAKKLHTWIVSPTSKGYTPEFMREPVAKFLETVDFTSKRALGGGDDTWNDQKFKDALEELRDAIGKLGNQQSDIDGGAQSFMGYIDLPANYVQNFNENISAIRKALDVGGRRTDTPVNRMTAAQMRELAQAFRVLNSSIVKVNTLVSNARYSSAKLAADETIDDMNELRARRKTNKAFEVLNTTFNWKNTTPYYAFQRMGRGAKAIFESLQDGWDKMAQNIATVIEFSRDTFTAKESQTWAKEISEVKLDNGETIQMTTAQKMSLYCLSKRPQAIGHLLGGGIRVADIEGKRGGKISQAENYTLTLDDINRITGSLTDRQKEVADALQRFMSDQCAKWGNEISMKRFGFNQMTELFYFPIETDSNNRARIDETKDGKNSMFRLLNMSSLKPLTPNANNAIVIHDIFDVFAGHASDMAKYNALALPILDFIKWYNHVERTEVRSDDGKTTGQITTRSTQKALERAFGQDAKSYLTAFIKDLNAEHDGGRNDGLINSIVGRAKSAAVGWNLRVYGLQITSLPRAAYAINPVYLAKGLAKVKSLNPVNAIKGTEAQQKVGILKWKDLGFYSTDISRSTRDMIKRNEGRLDKLRDWQMAAAGWGDNWVSNIIYEAAKAEMKAKNPEIKPGSAEYDRRLNKRVREIVYKTQVVDSTMTRSEMMRSKGLASTVTAFMSEPTLTVNMLNESIQKAVETARKGGNVRDILRASGGMVVRAASTWVFTSVVTTLMESMFDALRDDDEYETFLQKFWSAIWGDKWYNGNAVQNLNPITMFPILNEAWSIMVEGYEDNSLITQVFSQFRSFFDAIRSYQKGNTTLYNVIYKGAQTVSSMSGHAAANAARDGVSLYNTLLAPAWGTPKLQTYADNETTAAKAYYEAIKAGDTERAEYYRERMDVTGMDMAKVEKKIATLAGDDYVAGSINAKVAKNIMVSEGAVDAEDLDDKIAALDFEKKAGFAYGSMKEKYTEGIIDRNKAINYIMEYEDVERAAAQVKVNKWQYEIDTKRSYSDLKKDYVAGRISNAQLRKYLKEVELLDEEKIEERVSNYDYYAYKGKDSAPKYWRLAYTYETGGDYEAYADEIFKEIMDTGKSWKQARSSIASSLASYYKKDYLAVKGTAAGDRMLEQILDVYEAIGYDRAYERKYIAENWELDD